MQADQPLVASADAPKEPEEIPGALPDVPEEEIVDVGLFPQDVSVLGSGQERQPDAGVGPLEGAGRGRALEHVAERAETNPQNPVPVPGANDAHRSSISFPVVTNSGSGPGGRPARRTRSAPRRTAPPRSGASFGGAGLFDK